MNSQIGSRQMTSTSSAPSASAATVTSGAPPALISTETTPPAKTLYLNIPLGSERPARAMTGLFIPPNYRHQAEVDLVLYLHGFKPKSGLTINRYWNTRFFPYWPLRERLNDSGKNVVLVAPTLGDRSQTGLLIKAGGLDNYIA